MRTRTQTETYDVGHFTIFYNDYGTPDTRAEQGVKSLVKVLQTETTGIATPSNKSLVKLLSDTTTELFSVRSLTNEELPYDLQNRKHVIGFAPKAPESPSKIVFFARPLFLAP